MSKLNKRMDQEQKSGGAVQSYGAITGETPEQVADQEELLEDALENAIYKFIGILVVAVAIGAFVGICCVVLIGKCLNRNQKQRLQLVKSRSDMQFVEESTVGASVSG